MFKATPNPPETDDVSPYESLDSKKLHEAANRALDHYLNPSALKSPMARKPSTMYMVAPDIKDEDLLAHTCESLAQASVCGVSGRAAPAHGDGDSTDRHAGRTGGEPDAG